jgi:hypothetical protein
MDESTNISYTAQLLIFIRGIDDNFCITEELACMQSIKGTTTGSDIFREFQQGISTLKVSISNLCNITTHEAPNMTGKKCGFIGVFNQEYPENDFVFLHCVIHQDALCKSALDMKHVLDVIVKAIRSRGLHHRQFQEFIDSVQAEYPYVLYYTKVRWLSAGHVFERVWQLKEEIISFMCDKQRFEEFEQVEDVGWLSDFAFFTDLLSHLNKLNLKFQGRNQFLDDIWGHLRALKMQLMLFSNQVSKNDLSHFPKLQSIAPLNEEKIISYEASLRKLHGNLNGCFKTSKA